MEPVITITHNINYIYDVMINKSGAFSYSVQCVSLKEGGVSAAQKMLLEIRERKSLLDNNGSCYLTNAERNVAQFNGEKSLQYIDNKSKKENKNSHTCIMCVCVFVVYGR